MLARAGCSRWKTCKIVLSSETEKKLSNLIVVKYLSTCLLLSLEANFRVVRSLGKSVFDEGKLFNIHNVLRRENVFAILFFCPATLEIPAKRWNKSQSFDWKTQRKKCKLQCWVMISQDDNRFKSRQPARAHNFFSGILNRWAFVK